MHGAQARALLCLGRGTRRRWETELVMVNDKVGLWALSGRMVEGSVCILENLLMLRM